MKSFEQFLMEEYLIEKGLAIPASIAAAGAVAIGSYRSEPKLPPSVDTSITASEVKPDAPPQEEPSPGFQTLSPGPEKPQHEPSVLRVIPDDAGQRNSQIKQMIRDHIKSTEGFRNQAYQDSAGVWTVGYGSTYHYDENGNIAGRVKQGDRIDEEQASRYIDHHIQNNVMSHLSRNLPTIFDSKHNKDIDPMYVARMVTMAYNVGHDALINPKRTSIAQPLIRANQEQDPKERQNHLITALLGTYDFHKAGGNPIPGLLHRRHDKVISVLNSMKQNGSLSDDEYQQHASTAREIYKNHLREMGE